MGTLRYIFYGHSPSADSRRAVDSYKQKYVHQALLRKSVTDRLNMTIAVDWDVKPQNKQIAVKLFKI